MASEARHLFEPRSDRPAREVYHSDQCWCVLGEDGRPEMVWDSGLYRRRSFERDLWARFGSAENKAGTYKDMQAILGDPC
jgi:hypothetical protein